MNPEEQITVTMTAGQWNQVMQLLAERPYKLAAPHIQTIQMQCMNHEMRNVQEKHSRVSDEG